jgi:hypothetical protein
MAQLLWFCKKNIKEHKMEINTMTGLPAKTVKATLEVELTFRVGGDSDADRIDAVRMALDDHYDETVANSFWRDAISGLVVKDVEVRQ